MAKAKSKRGDCVTCGASKDKRIQTFGGFVCGQCGQVVTDVR